MSTTNPSFGVTLRIGSCDVVDITSIRDPCRLLLKLEPDTIRDFRQLDPNQICSLIQDAINTGVRSHISEPQVVIMAIKHLPSGDLEVYTNTAENARLLSRNRLQWCPLVSPGTRLYETTYGIVVHGVVVGSLGGMETEQQRTTIKQRIVAENTIRLATLKHESDIVSIGWLSKKRKRRLITSITLEFRRASQANECILSDLTLDGKPHQCFIQDRNRYFKQCFNCWSLGHSTKTCKARKRCCRCSEIGHVAAACPKPNTYNLCRNCHGPHIASDARCPSIACERKIIDQLQAMDKDPQTKRLWADFEQRGSLTSRNVASGTDPVDVIGRNAPEEASNTTPGDMTTTTPTTIDPVGMDAADQGSSAQRGVDPALPQYRQARQSSGRVGGLQPSQNGAAASQSTVGPGSTGEETQLVLTLISTFNQMVQAFQEQCQTFLQANSPLYPSKRSLKRKSSKISSSEDSEADGILPQDPATASRSGKRPVRRAAKEHSVPPAKRLRET